MKIVLGLAALVALALLPAHAGAAVPKAAIAAPPDWVENVESVHTPPKNGVHPTGGEYYLLVDRQIHALAHRERYYHFAIALTTQGAVESNSQVSIDFDPAYQKLTLHSVRLWRNGTATEQLSADKVQMLQRETQMEELIYDGRWTASLILEDVRPGDIIEYSYTLAGENPAYRGHFSARTDLQWGVPVLHTYFRLLWPHRRPLTITPYNTDLQPKKVNHGAVDEYRIERRELSAQRVESEAPSWYIPWPRINFSDLATWTEVSDWALRHYESEGPIPEEVEAIARKLKADNATPAGQLAAALHYVQREVRYFGRENGMGSHVPAPPELTLQRRYGDCKAKSLLLMSLLKALGIEAHAALVNTRYGKVLSHDGPRISAFDHVIVQATLGDSTYWLDPTMSDQKGDLATIYQPDYGYALVLRKGTRGLTSMKRSSQLSRRIVEEVVDLRAGIGQKKKALFRVKTTYTGYEAENFRSRLSADGEAALQKDYLNYYAKQYPDIERAQPMEVKDEPSQNRIELYENYTVPNIWTNNSEASRWEAEFYSDALYWLLDKPEERRRAAPFEVPFPADITETITVFLPERWKLKNDQSVIENPYFSFRQKTEYYPKEKKLVLWYHFRYLTDHVPGDEIGAYLEAVDKVWDALDYRITWRYTKAGAPAHSDGAVSGGRAGYGLVLALLLAAAGFSAFFRAPSNCRYCSAIMLSLALFNIHEFYWFYRAWAGVRKNGHVFIARF